MSEQRKIKILIVGSGQLGSMCAKIATTRIPNCEVVVTGHDRHTHRDAPERFLDLRAGEDEICETVKRLAPDVVINCAADNFVDLAEGEGKSMAIGLNHAGALKLAAATRELDDAMYIGFSTDYVFNGQEIGPDGYTEGHKPHPINVYGKTKLDGDEDVLAALGGNEITTPTRHYILRTSSLWTDPVSDHSNFVKTVIERMQHGQDMKVVNTQIMKPTYALDLAEAVMVLIEMAFRGEAVEYGLYNFANSGATSWYWFARAIAEQAFEGDAFPISPVDAYPQAAARPKDSRLDCTKWVKATGLTPRHWAETLKHVGKFEVIPEDVSAD
jgi:dTDP-4-dehydrorhamnose reductase